MSAHVFASTVSPGAAFSSPRAFWYRPSISRASRRAWAIESAISCARAWCGFGSYTPLIGCPPPGVSVGPPPSPGPYGPWVPSRGPDSPPFDAPGGASMPLLPKAVPPGFGPPVIAFLPPEG